MRATRLIIVSVFLTVLAACGSGGGDGGGGGSSGNSPPPPPPPPPPSALQYSSPQSLEVGTAVNLSPTVSGQVTSYSVAPALPAGISLAAPSGVISGTPTATAPPATYTITASNSSGSTTFALVIAVSPLAHSVSGRITAAQALFTDADVNDPLAPFAANDTIVQAQVVSNPVTIGGYVNVPGAGSEGRSLTTGDLHDVYRVEATPGQYVSMFVADPPGGDADLILRNSAGTIVGVSNGTGSTEQLIIGVAGTYYVDILAFSGATNYVLSIGLPASASDVGALTSQSDFVPMEAIVRWKSGAGTSPSGASSKASMAMQALGLTRKGGDTSRAMLLSVSGRLNAAQVTTAQKIVPAEVTDALRSEMISDELRAKWDTLQAIKALRQHPDVATAEPNYLDQLDAAPNDTSYQYQWHYPTINLPGAWDTTQGSANVIVAVIDSGILHGHPDFAGRLAPGFDFIRDPGFSIDGDGYDANPEDPGAVRNGRRGFHGTHVAGTIAAATNNAMGVAGVGWNVRAMPLRVCGQGGCPVFDTIQAILYAAGLPNDTGFVPQVRASVINMSLGGPQEVAERQQAINQAIQRGVIVVAAAGNDSIPTPHYPGSSSNVVNVSSVDARRALAPYSNFGASIDVAAPGGNLNADVNGDGQPDGVLSTHGEATTSGVRYIYSFLQGTSMAAPHVAGVAALMKSVNPNLTPAQFDQFLIAGALTDELGPAGRDDSFGYGLINARKAVTAASSASPPVAGRLQVSPTSLNFGMSETSIEILLRNAGTAALTVQSVTPTPGATWLSTAQVQLEPGTNLGRYAVRVDRTGLQPGTYSATVNVINTGSATPLAIPVIMQVTATAVTSNAGFHYVLLIDPQSGETKYQVEIGNSGGNYDYSFADVAPGMYDLAAGTDINNDTFICDAGEACGAYRTLDEPTTLDVNGDLSSINFSTGFIVNTHQQSASEASDSERSDARRRRIR